MFFVAYLADQVSFKTIKLYLAGIRFAHIENSLPDPFQEAPLLHLLLRGIKRSVGLSSHQRLPITMTLLQHIKEELARAPDFLPTDKLMLWSAFTLAFYSFLRSSEFTSPSATQFNPLVHLCFTDVSFTSEGCLTLHLKSSKTGPYRQGCSLLVAPSPRLCCASPQEVPLSAFHQWCIPTLHFPVWGLPHQSQSHLNPSHSPPTSQYSHRALYISQLQDRCRYDSSRSWSPALAYPNTGTLVKQPLHPLYPNSTFYPPEGSWDTGHITPFIPATFTCM